MARSLMADSLFTVVTRFFSKASALLVFALLAHTLTIAEFGIYGYIMAMTLLVSTLCDFGTRHSVSYYLGAQPERIRAIASQALTWNIALGLLGVVALIFYLESEATVSDTGGNVFSVAMIFLVLLSIRIQQAVPLGTQRLKVYNLSESLPRTALLISTVVLWALGWLTLQTALWSFFFSNLLAALYLLANTLGYSGTPKLDRQLSKLLIIRGALFVPGVALMIISKRISVVMMGELTTSAETGLYFGAQRLSEIVTEVAIAIGIVVFSHNVKQTDRKLAVQATADVTRAIVLVLAIICLGLAIASPLMLKYVLGESFASESTLFRICLAGTLLGAISSILYPSLSALESPLLSFWVFIPGTLINIVAILLLVPIYGAEGAAASTAIGNLLISLSFLYVYRVKYKVPIREFIMPGKKDFLTFKQRVRNLALRRRRG